MPIFFILIVGTAIAIRIMMKKNKVDLKKAIEELAEKERVANLSRKREIEKEFYILPNTDILPIKNYEDNAENKKIINAQNIVLKKSKLTMIKFDEQISNTDLKLRYGFSNLDNITMYEEHYNSYIQELVLWAELLINRNNLTDAEIILLEAVRLKCDLSKAYIMLIDIYVQTKNSAKLQELIKIVNNSKIYLKTKILKYLESNNIDNFEITKKKDDFDE